MDLKNFNDDELRVILRFLKEQEQDRKKVYNKIIRFILAMAVIIAGTIAGAAILNHLPQ